MRTDLYVERAPEAATKQIAKRVSPKVIIFDLDGTLVDAYRAVWLSLNMAFKAVGLPRMSYQVVKKSVGWGERILVAKFVPPEKVEKTLTIYRQSHRKALMKGVRFLPGAKKLILDLHQKGTKLAIASNRPTEFCELILKNLKVRKYFEIVLCADRVKRPKPAGDMLKEILKRLEAKTSEAIYIGDMTIDVQTGRRANVKTIAVTTGSSSRSEILKEKPFQIIGKLKELSF